MLGNIFSSRLLYGILFGTTFELFPILCGPSFKFLGGWFQLFHVFIDCVRESRLGRFPDLSH